MTQVQMKAKSARCRNCGEVIEFDQTELSEATTEAELLEKVREQLAFHRCDAKSKEKSPEIPTL